MSEEIVEKLILANIVVKSRNMHLHHANSTTRTSTEHGDGQLVVTLHVSDSGSQVPLLLALHSNPSNYGRSHQLTQFVCHHPQH